jgi:WD40 repeat protein
MKRSLFLLTALLVPLTGLSAMAEPPLREVVHKGPIWAVTWSASGKLLATGSQDGTALLTDAATGEEILRVQQAGGIKGLALSRDGKVLAVRCEPGTIRLFDAATGKEQKSLTVGLDMYRPHLMAFTPDGGTLTAAGVGEWLRWQHAKGGASASRTGKPPAGGFAALAHNGGQTAWGSPDGRIQVHDMDGKRHLFLQVGPARSMAFAPDGRTLAIGAADKTIRLWDLGTKTEIRRYEGLREPAVDLCFSGDGKTLAALAAGGTLVRTWDVERARARRQLTAFPSPATDIALSPDGRRLVTASDDGKARVWNVAGRELPKIEKRVVLPEQKLDALWTDLAGADYDRAEKAFLGLAGAENAVPFLRERVRRVAIPDHDPARVAKLVSDLDAPAYAVRQKAFAELGKYGELAEVPLRKLLEGKPSAEADRRARQLRAKLKEPALTPDRLRALESLELLAALASPEARRVLEELAREALIPRLRAEAAEAVQRLSAKR